MNDGTHSNNVRNTKLLIALPLFPIEALASEGLDFVGQLLTLTNFINNVLYLKYFALLRND